MNASRSPEIAILLGETGRDYEIANDLMRSGCVVYVCSSAQEVHALLRAGKTPILLSEEPQSAAFQHTALTRLVYARPPTHGSPGDVQVRVAGSDGTEQLHTILDTMRRHLSATHRPPPPPIPQVTSWRLSTPPRVLTSPDGAQMPLALTEWQFLSHLFAAPGQTLGYAQWQAGSRGGAVGSLHNVAVLVSRLRRKAQQYRITLPLEAIRSTGYVFTQPCRQTGSGHD
ncbi:hypothetical protein PIGHUM_04072 [Pigmentiphaga humi]|uniref:OmpR/PhoB-type domain-containing protein n=1 Tax=Pigmentiphaga humi TaxID=2478468 RepID=A0A3P4B8M6_9BURK|nr:helix-turn-helix domain-containing protein [Pigmentiphaga humi]VCU71980.1 hypothetical protein PIGHUM_04072 [Pigmentiphaga humi]